MSDKPNGDGDVPYTYVPLSESQILPNDSRLMNAAFMACCFVVRNYWMAGFTAHNCRNRLQQRADECRRAGLWDARQYNYCTYLYSEAILSVYGERLTFHKAND